MSVAHFLSRVVPAAAGKYLSICWSSLFHGKVVWQTRSYPITEVQQAAARATWAAQQNADAYFALAAFNICEFKHTKSGTEYAVAKRDQANVHSLRTLVIDADVARPGDGKDPTKVFPDRRAACAWLASFLLATGMPKPNLGVDSGYGYHWYWVLEDALSLTQWKPLADALKSAMLAHGWTCDTAPTIDGARVLRPPGTFNMKSGTPAPVTELSQLAAADYPNDQITQVLTPWIGVQQVVTRATGTGGRTASIHALGGSGSLGPRPAHVSGAGLNPAAHQNLPTRPMKFANIVKKCGQAALSLANHGADERRDLWYMRNITLLGFCVDGAEYVHEISNGDARYTWEETEGAWAQAQNEIATKGIGAPLCSSYDTDRPGICSKCAYFRKIASPIALGGDEGALPYGYHRADLPQRIEREGKEGERTILLLGDMHSPTLDVLATGGHQLRWTYVIGGEEFSCAYKDLDIGSQTMLANLAQQGMTLARWQVIPIGELIVAWITKLRSEGAGHRMIQRPFGWNFARQGGELVGLAIAGTLYRTDGQEEYVPGADGKLCATYQPMGTFENWRRAASLFEGPHARADLQALIAPSFGAPLVALTSDVRGMTANYWSTGSGIGKSTAIKIGQSVWGDYSAMQSMKDTPNAVMRSLAGPRVLIRFWDEFRVAKEWIPGFVELIYTIPQGKERMRLTADITIREPGEWETLMVITSNRSYSDILLTENSGTDSGLLRLFEMELSKEKLPFSPDAGSLIKLAETNYGHAGRIYAKWLGANASKARESLSHIMRVLTEELGLMQEERYYATFIATTVVGATIARGLGLFDFNVQGIYAKLKEAFIAMRGNRVTRTVITNEGEYDIEELLNRFAYDMSDWKIRTAQLTAYNGTRSSKEPTLYPRANGVRVQVSEAPAMLRADRRYLLSWLHEHNLPGSKVIEQMERDLDAQVHRATLAGGTKWSSGRIMVVDIPLVGDLAEHLMGGDEDA